LLKVSKQIGFSDRQIASAIGSSELAVRKLRTEHGITPVVKQIDTGKQFSLFLRFFVFFFIRFIYTFCFVGVFVVAAEFPAQTNYLYTTYNGLEHDVSFEDRGIMVLGSGVYRIGSSVEFDWCAVRAIRTLRANGLKTVMLNYNPETVSTDYDEADRLYFDNITLERVLDIYDIERASGVIVSMGGQTPNNIALPLLRQNVKILGTSPEMIDNAENRYKFSRMLDRIEVDQPQWKELSSLDDAQAFCNKVGYPVLVRPSYVLSGAAMNVVYSPDDLFSYLKQATAVSQDKPVVISKYIAEAKEIEMDAVARDGQLVYHVISEHVENAGVHSGDATLVLPPQDLDPETVAKIEVATRKIALALNVTGPINIQFIAKNNAIKVIECNLRASRSFPFVSKVLGVDLIEMATKAMINVPFDSYPEATESEGLVAVKVPQFSFSRLLGADPVLGVEMASTGEVACFGQNKYEAYLKGLISTGFKLPKKNILMSIGSYKEKQEFLPFVRKLHELGFELFGTPGTGDFIQEHGIPIKTLEVFDDDRAEKKSEYSLTQRVANNLIDLYINLPSNNKYRRPASYMSRGYITRRLAVDFSIPLITNIKCAKLFVEALARNPSFLVSSVDCKTSHHTEILPGLIDVHTVIPSALSAAGGKYGEVARSGLMGGFTQMNLVPYVSGALVDSKEALEAAKTNASEQALIDFTFSMAATSSNAVDVSSVAADVTALCVAFESNAESGLDNVSQLSAHLKSWPASSLVVADVQSTELASILFVASLLGRGVHISNVSTREDLELIISGRQKGMQITCDASVYNLFLTKEAVSWESKRLGTTADVEFLWQNLDEIDCFSTGALPAEFAARSNMGKDMHLGMSEALPLLLSAVAEDRLTIATITEKLYTNPMKIFKLPKQPDTFVEVEVDRDFLIPSTSSWSPFAGKTLKGFIHRVVIKGQTAFLDGGVFVQPGFGQDVRTVGKLTSAHAEVVPPPTHTGRPTHVARAKSIAEPLKTKLPAVSITNLDKIESQNVQSASMDRLRHPTAAPGDVSKSMTDLFPVLAS
jgi:carbamoyl-phosphate synthase/aspartate carbamoyltransferase